MEQQGKISVLMGVYNCADTLPVAIDSILAQTYTDWELIVCDDASSDDTYAVAKAYRDRYSNKIVLLQNKENKRLAYTLNRCLQAATGEYVARMDGDDLSHPDRFEKQIAFLKEHPAIDLVGTAVRVIDDDETEGIVLRHPDRPDRFSMRRTTAFHHPTIMTYKRVYEALGGYTVLPRTERGQDVDLWFRFFHAGYRGANMSEVLYTMREGLAAVRRRTAHTRWINFQTTMYGYRLLSYPWHWYIRPIAELWKIAVPPSLILRYRKWQKKRQDKTAT